MDWIHEFNAAKKILLENLNTLQVKSHRTSQFCAPVWIPDDLALQCMICNRDFDLFHRKHHCRACGQIICDACSPNGFYIPGQSKSNRACLKCFDTLKDSGEFKMKYAHTSTFCTENHQPEDSEIKKHDSKWAFIRSKNSQQTLERMSTLLLNEESDHECSLCREGFTLFNWRV